MIAERRDKDLRFMLKPAELFGVQNPVSVALKRGTHRRRRFGPLTRCIGTSGGMGRQPLFARFQPAPDVGATTTRTLVPDRFGHTRSSFPLVGLIRTCLSSYDGNSSMAMAGGAGIASAGTHRWVQSPATREGRPPARPDLEPVGTEFVLDSLNLGCLGKPGWSSCGHITE